MMHTKGLANKLSWRREDSKLEALSLPLRWTPTTLARKLGRRNRRDVRADYRKTFGEEPPPMTGVALMTDNDHTADSTQALYGDIVFRPDRSPADTTSAAGDIPPNKDL